MVEHNWPLKNKLPAGYQHLTKAELLEFMDHVHPDTPIWIDNYWPVRHHITQRPVEMTALGEDGFHIG